MKTFNQASKAEETEFVADLVKRFAKPENSQSYLASFFTPELLAWFGVQVRDDMSTDLVGALYHQRTAEVKRVEQEREAEKTARQEAERQLSVARRALADVQAQVKNLEYQAANHAAWADRVAQKLHEANATEWALRRENEALKEELQALKSEMQAVKAASYDAIMLALKGKGV